VEPTDIYETNSIHVAAFIYANGIQLLAVTFKRGPRFEFDNKDDMAKKMAEKYYVDTSTPARTLLEAFSQLRREISRASQVRDRTLEGTYKQP